MADGVKFEVRGASETIGALTDLAANGQRQYLTRAMKAAASSLAQLLSLIAPKRTGRLAENIGVRTSSAGSIVRGRVIVNTEGKRGNPQNAFYWRFLEKGWHDRAGREHSEPFIEVPVEDRAQATAQQFIDAVGQAIEDAAEKAAS